MNTTPAPIVTDIPEGAFSIEDLEMLHPNERAAVEADMAADKEAAPQDVQEAPAPVAEAPEPPADQPAAPAEAAPHARLADLQGQVEAAKTALDTLAEKYDDGEITSAEWRTQLAILTARQAQAMAAVTNVQAQVQSADQQWYGMVKTSLDTLGIAPNTAQLAIYDSILRKIEEVYSTLPDAEKISAAEMQYRQLYGNTSPAPTRAAQPATRTAPQADPEDAAALGSVPPTISRIPADSYDPAQGQYQAVNDVISRGDVYAAENALSRMSPADLERFLQQG